MHMKHSKLEESSVARTQLGTSFWEVERVCDGNEDGGLKDNFLWDWRGTIDLLTLRFGLIFSELRLEVGQNPKASTNKDIQEAQNIIAQALADEMISVTYPHDIHLRRRVRSGMCDSMTSKRTEYLINICTG